MIGIKVVMVDPSGTMDNLGNPRIADVRHDPFGIVGLLYNHNTHKIQFKLAKEFQNVNYSIIARYLEQIKKTIRPNFMGIETNNRGTSILKLFRTAYGLKFLHGVNTSGDMTAETRQKGFSMDKNYMVNGSLRNEKKVCLNFQSHLHQTW